jgi:hypothetical protein
MVSDSTVNGGISNAGTIDGAEGGAIHIGYGGIINGDITNTGILNNWDSNNNNNAAVVVDNGTINGKLLNSGTINGRDENPGILVQSGTITNGIVNDINGKILSNNVGIMVVGSTVGGITNAGLIDGAEGGPAGMGIAVGLTTIRGNITNSGTINAGLGVNPNNNLASGIYVGMSAIEGDIINTGTVNAPSGSALFVQASSIGGKIINSGTLSGLNAIEIVNDPAPVLFNNDPPPPIVRHLAVIGGRQHFGAEAGIGRLHVVAIDSEWRVGLDCQRAVIVQAVSGSDGIGGIEGATPGDIEGTDVERVLRAEVAVDIDHGTHTQLHCKPQPSRSLMTAPCSTSPA